MLTTTRTQLDIIKRKYEAYVTLYRSFNEGSAEGIASFSDFYWRYTYYYRYKEGGNHMSSLGY